MTLSEKIVFLRKQNNLSQEELAEKLKLSRQAVSRWEVGTALPDASNLLQLSKFFGVTADYLLNEEESLDNITSAAESEGKRLQAPCRKPTEADNEPNKSSYGKAKKIIALCVSAGGLLGNFVIYVLSRFHRVLVPQITYQNGEKWYHWSNNLTGYSYKYFLQAYDLEFLTAVFWILFIGGLAVAFISKGKMSKVLARLRQKLSHK